MALSRVETSTYSPSLAPGVGGKPPGIGGVVYESSLLLLVPGLVAVVGRAASSCAELFAGSVGSECCPNMDSSGILCIGLRGGIGRPFAFSRSSVSRNLASSSSNSEVCDTTACFL